MHGSVSAQGETPWADSATSRLKGVTPDHVMWGLERRMQMNLRLRIETPLGRHQNRNCLPGPGGARKPPTYWPCDVRCTGGVTLVWAFVRNLRTWFAMVR